MNDSLKLRYLIEKLLFNDNKIPLYQDNNHTLNAFSKSLVFQGKWEP